MKPQKSKEKSKRSLRDVYADDYKKKDKGGSTRTNYLDTSKYKDVKWYKIKNGKNRLDIIPYEITSDNHPQGREKGQLDYKLDIWVHKYVGDTEADFLCLKETFNEPCPICKEIKKMIDSKEYTWKDKEVKDLKPKHREVFNVIDTMEDENEVLLFDFNHHEFLKEILEEAESSEDGEGFITFADLEEGKTIAFRGSEREGDFKDSYEPKNFAFKDREAYDEDILEKVYPLDAMLIIPTYEEVQNALYGMNNEEEDDKPKKSRKVSSDDDDDDEDEPAPKKKYHKIEDDDEEEEEPEDDDDTDESEEEEEPEDDDDDEKPAPKKRRQAKVEDDDDDEDEPAPKKKASKKCPHGHKFGDDCDETKDCKKCKIFDHCADAFGK